MSGDEQSAMKREINAALIKMRREQRARLERQALRRILAAWLLLALLCALLLLAALGFMRWRQQQQHDAAEQSCAGARGSGAWAHNPSQGGSTPRPATTCSQLPEWV